MFITDKSRLESYSSEKRLWQGIPSIEVTKKGRIFVTFYSGGVKETLGNYVVLLKSDSGCELGEPIAAAVPEEGHRTYDPCLWIDPLGRLWLIWADAPEHSVRAVICDDPDAEELSFGEERIIGSELDVMMNRPTVLSSGEWLFPMAVWNYGVYGALPRHKTHLPGAYAIKTVDCGKSFVALGKADVPERTFDEHMILERSDGVLAIYVRTRYGIGVSYSYDRGKSWTRGIDSGLGGPCSRFAIQRLKSGRVMLVNHVNFTGRNNLTALLSEDDGRTFKYSLLLDSRDEVSYPDFKEADDGFIYVVYDRERGAFKSSLTEALSDAREILIAKITEEDILAGELVNPESGLRIVANKLGEYRGDAKNPFDEIQYFSNEELAARLIATKSGEEIIDEVFNTYPVPCIRSTNIYASDLDARIDRFIASGYSDAEILAEIIRTVKAASLEKDDFPLVSSLMRQLDESFAEDIRTGELARRFNCSTYHLCHEFKRVTGLTVTEYRNARRLTAAKRLLVSTGKRICDIAAECGYSDESYFGRIFLREEGVTPSEYRRMLRR